MIGSSAALGDGWSSVLKVNLAAIGDDGVSARGFLKVRRLSEMIGVYSWKLSEKI